jgi:hypothetical protein
MIVRRASLHRNMLARQSDLVVPGKWTVLSVEPRLSNILLQARRVKYNTGC